MFLKCVASTSPLVVQGEVCWPKQTIELVEADASLQKVGNIEGGSYGGNLVYCHTLDPGPLLCTVKQK
jgi:hypothetical protein